MTNELSLLNSLFDDVFAGNHDFPVRSYNVPSVDVKENDTAYTLEMDLPGRSEKDVNIELEHGTLTISSKLEECKEVSDKDSKKKDSKSADKYLIRERRSSSFTRRFTLPENVAEDSIKANFKNGVLVITMNKKEPATPKKIAISVA